MKVLRIVLDKIYSHLLLSSSPINHPLTCHIYPASPPRGPEPHVVNRWCELLGGTGEQHDIQHVKWSRKALLSLMEKNESCYLQLIGQIDERYQITDTTVKHCNGNIHNP